MSHLRIVEISHNNLRLVCGIEENRSFHGMLLRGKLRQLSDKSKGYCLIFLIGFWCLVNAAFVK